VKIHSLETQGLQLTAFATTSVQFVSRSLTDESKSYEYLTSQILENLHLLTSLQHSELAFGGSFSGVVTTGRRHPVRKDK
jgi:hypothetical protein